MHRELLVELVLLGHDADPRPDLLAVAGRVHPEDPQLALGHGRHASDHAHRRRLAGAVRPEEPERLAAVDLDLDPVDGGEVAEPLDQAARRDQRLAGVWRLGRQRLALLHPLVSSVVRHPINSPMRRYPAAAMTRRWLSPPRSAERTLGAWTTFG